MNRGSLREVARRLRGHLVLALLALLAFAPRAAWAADFDGDGINDDIDNCPSIANPLQEDDDGACDLKSGACVEAEKLDGAPCAGGACFAGGCVPDSPDPAGGTGGAGGSSTTMSASTSASTSIGSSSASGTNGSSGGSGSGGAGANGGSGDAGGAGGALAPGSTGDSPISLHGGACSSSPAPAPPGLPLLLGALSVALARARASRAHRHPRRSRQR